MSEYWIYENGGVEFADGDVGDRGHEAVVIDSLQRDIAEKCEQAYDIYKTSWGGKSRFSNDDYIDWDEFKNALAEAYRNKLIQEQPQKKRKFENADEDALMISAIKAVGIKQIEWIVANGRSDARDYAMQYWGWKTYRDRNIDTWLWRTQDLQAIVSGIDEIAEHMGWSEKRLQKLGFTINIHSNNKSFTASYERLKNPPSNVAAVAVNQKPDVTNMTLYGTQQANLRTKEFELSQMHPAYKRPGVSPFGDSTQMTFRNFIALAEVSAIPPLDP
jgi:hypothetical protein